MQTTKNQWVIIGVVCVIAILIIVLFHPKSTPTVPVETATTTTPTALTTPVENPLPAAQATTTSTGVQPFPINSADQIVSWSFTGAYAGNNARISQTTTDIQHLTSLLGSGQYDDYDLYLGIGDDDNLLGDGKGAYQNYNRSIQIHPHKGLAYTNLAHLMVELGAFYTAADAYAKATAVEPAVLEYQIERLNYLTQQFPTDTARITAALADASKQFGDTAQILTIEAQWLTVEKRYADAIQAWQTVEMLSPGQDMTAINAAIAALQAKQ